MAGDTDIRLRLLFLSERLAPANLRQHPCGGAEDVFADTGGPFNDFPYGRVHEGGQESAHDQVVNLLLHGGEPFGRFAGGDDRKVIGDSSVVEYPLRHLGPGRIADAVGERGVDSVQGTEYPAHLGGVVFGQTFAVGAWIGEHLVLFVEGLGRRKGGPRRKSEAPV